MTALFTSARAVTSVESALSASDSPSTSGPVAGSEVGSGVPLKREQEIRTRAVTAIKIVRWSLGVDFIDFLLRFLISADIIYLHSKQNIDFNYNVVIIHPQDEFAYRYYQFCYGDTVNSGYFDNIFSCISIPVLTVRASRQHYLCYKYSHGIIIYYRI
jgi:hypothetical protein